MSESTDSEVDSAAFEPLSKLLSNWGLDTLGYPAIKRALTHRSYCAEHPGVKSNERLEFLGDSILGAVVGKYIFNRFTSYEEGELTKLRASVVSAQSLSKVAASIGLGKLLLLGKGEESSGGREKGSILSDSLEALMGVVYLELGFSAAEKLILGLMVPEIETHADGPGYSDFKSRLQEILAQLMMDSPRYLVEWSGPDHARRFHAIVSSGDKNLGQGTGSSKKIAEQSAAENALDLLSKELAPPS